MKRLNLLFLTLVCACIGAYSQIGYQVAVMDQTTGKPKANENVAVSVTITDNAGGVICSETHDVTTNDVGIATIQVGNANTFSNVDWTKLPLWVSATVGGITISKSQILNVPVAEHAKHYGDIDYNTVGGLTYIKYYATFTFHSNGTVQYTYNSDDPKEYESCTLSYEIDGNMLFVKKGNFVFAFYYSRNSHKLYNLED